MSTVKAGQVGKKSPDDATAIDGCINSKTEPLAKSNGTTVIATDVNHNSEEQQVEGEDKVVNSAGDQDDDDYQHQNVAPVFQPKVSLPLINIDTLECDEDVIVELRARIYRLDTSPDLDEPEFKERGTGTVKILCHQDSKKFRILMRRDKTLKICANHYITSEMKLSPHNGSDKVFLYSTFADYYDDESNPETFAIRFGTAEKAKTFKEAFEKAVKDAANNNDDATDQLVDELEKIKIEANNNHISNEKEKVEKECEKTDQKE